MTITKRTMVISAVLATLGASAVGVGTTFAATGTGVPKPMDTLIEAIATKFHLAPADVQAVFEEQREIHQTEKAENNVTRLNKAVKDGKLTQAQADAIIENVSDQQAFFESLKGMTQEERQSAIAANHDSQKAWAEASGIPKEFLPHRRPMMKGAPGKMHRGMEMMHDGNTQDDEDQTESE